MYPVKIPILHVPYILAHHCRCLSSVPWSFTGTLAAKIAWESKALWMGESVTNQYYFSLRSLNLTAIHPLLFSYSSTPSWITLRLGVGH